MGKDEQTLSSELIIVTEPDDLIEQPTPKAVLTLHTEPDHGWGGCGHLCPARQSGGSVLA